MFPTRSATMIDATEKPKIPSKFAKRTAQYNEFGCKVKCSRTSMCDQLSLATTSHKRPPIQNTKIFPVKALQLEPLVNDHLL